MIYGDSKSIQGKGYWYLKHGYAKLFAKTFQEQQNGTEVLRRLGLLQKRGKDQYIPKGPLRVISLIEMAKVIEKSMKKHVDFRNYLMILPSLGI